MNNMLRVKKAIQAGNFFIDDLKEGGKKFFDNVRTIGAIFYTNRELEEVFKEIFPVNELGAINSFLWNLYLKSGFMNIEAPGYIEKMNVIKTYLENYLQSNILENDGAVKGEGGRIVDNTKVFIVHGRDNEAKQETARFIERLGLKAIILHELANKGQTIIEKIEENSNVGFAVVLYTPCDEGKAKTESELQSRARQNVVFEHGYIMAKIGRKNVCALVKGKVEKPNDISGVVYIDMDSYGAWKNELVKEMKECGYNIDVNKLI